MTIGPAGMRRAAVLRRKSLRRVDYGADVRIIGAGDKSVDGESVRGTFDVGVARGYHMTHGRRRYVYLDWQKSVDGTPYLWRTCVSSRMGYTRWAFLVEVNGKS